MGSVWPLLIPCFASVRSLPLREGERQPHRALMFLPAPMPVAPLCWHSRKTSLCTFCSNCSNHSALPGELPRSPALLRDCRSLFTSPLFPTEFFQTADNLTLGNSRLHFQFLFLHSFLPKIGDLGWSIMLPRKMWSSQQCDVSAVVILFILTLAWYEEITTVEESSSAKLVITIPNF